MRLSARRPRMGGGMGMGMWRPVTVRGPRITLSASPVPEGSPVNTVIGPLAVADHPSGASGWTFSVDAVLDSGKFNVSVANLRTSGTWDYDGNIAGGYEVQIRGTKAGEADLTKIFFVPVTNVLEVTLGALALDGLTFIEASADSGAITGKTSGSTVTLSGSLPTGLTLDLTAMTWAWDGTGTVSTGSFDLAEAHPDASNSGRTSTQSWVISNIPDGTLTADNGDYYTADNGDYLLAA